MKTAADFEKVHAEITERLKAGGVVKITTYLRSTLYQAKHADYFGFDAAGVFVKSGKSKHYIYQSTGPLVSIRMGRLA